MKNKDKDPTLKNTDGAIPMNEQEVNAFIASKKPMIMRGKRSEEIPPAEVSMKPMIDSRIMTNDYMSIPMDKRVPKFDPKVLEQLKGSFDESKSAYNELLWNKAEAEAKAKTNDSGNWYDAYSKVIKEGDAFDWLSVPQWAIAHIETLDVIGSRTAAKVFGGEEEDYGIPEKVFNVAKKFASAEANIKAIITGDIARILDVADWRVTNIIPTKQSAYAFYRDVIGTLKRHGENLEATEFMQNLNESLYEYLDETPQKVIPWSDKKWEQYNAETQRIREKGEATDFYGYLKKMDKAFEWLDDWIGDEETSNWFTDLTDASQSSRTTRTDLVTEFALDNDVPYWSMDGANWTINNGVNTQTSLTAFAIEGMIPGGLFAKMKTIPMLVRGAKTAKEAQNMIRVGNVILNNKFTRGLSSFSKNTLVPTMKTGISGAVPAGSEVGQIGRDVERQAKLIYAEKYGGELWKQHWERQQQIYFRQAQREGNEKEVMSRMQQYEVEEVERFFVEVLKDKETYNKIVKQSAHAARIAIKGNSPMYFMNFPFGMALNNMSAFAKRMRVGYKNLAGGSISTRAASVKNLSVGKTMKVLGLEMASESLIEEGWINPWGEWRGIAYAKGETLTGDKFSDRLWEGELLESMLWGAAGALMMGAPQAVSYRSNKKAYKHYMEKYNEYVESLPEDAKKALFNIITSNSSTFKQAQLEQEIKEGNAAGQDTRALNALILRSQALTAFKTGMTEQLLDIYQQIANTSENVDEKQAAQDIIAEILELEKVYIDTQKWEDNLAVFDIVADIKANSKVALQNDMIIEAELKAAAVEQLEAGKKAFENADYYFEEDGTLKFTGKDADAFRDRMLVKPKVKHVSNYNKAILSNADITQELIDSENQLKDVTSDQYQRDVRVAKKVEQKVAKNFPDLFSSETGNEFRQKMSAIFKGEKLSKKREAILYKKYKNMYNGFKKSRQQNSMAPKGYVPIVSKNKLIHRQTQNIAKKFTRNRKADKNVDEDAAPIKVTPDDENYAKAEVNKWINNRKSAGDTNLTFDRMIRDYLGLDEKQLTENELDSRKEDTEAMFDMLEYGWSKGGHGETNGKEVYQEHFVEEFSTENSLQRFRNRIKGRTVKAEPKETTPVKQEKEDEITEEESDIIDEETKQETKEAIEAGEIVNEEKEEAEETVNSLGRYITLKFKAYKSAPISLMTGIRKIKIFRVKDSNIDGVRLFNVKKFKKGVRLALKITTESDYNIPIVYRINGEEQKFEKTSKSDYGGFFENKYGRITHFRYKNITVEIEGEGFKFSQVPTEVGPDGRLQDAVEYKSYDHREPGTVLNDEKNPNTRHHQHKVTDDFFVVNDGDFSALNNPNVHEVRVKRIINNPSKEGGKSYIELTIVDKDGKEGKLRKVEVENDREQNVPMGAADESDGAMVAWIDTYQTLLLDDTHDEAAIRAAQKNTIAFRKDVVNGKKKTAAIHANAPIGNPRFDEMTESTSIAEQDPTAILGQRIRGVIRIGTEVFENKKRKIVNKDEILNENVDAKSLPIDIRFIGINENGVELYAAFFAHGLEKGAKQDSVGSGNILWVLRAYITKFDTEGKLNHIISPKTRKAITEKLHTITSGYPISDFRGVKEYLNNFTIMDVPSDVKLDKKMNKTKFMTYVNSSKIAPGQPVLMMNGPVIFYAIKGEGIPTGGVNEDGSPKTTKMISIYLSESNFNAKELETLLTSIETKASSFKKSFNSEYSRKEGKIATFEKNGIINEMDYTEHQRNNLTTNIKAFEETSGGETFYVTATNTSVSIDTNQEGTAQAVAQTPSKKEEIIGLQMETLSEELPESKTTEEAIEDNKTPDEIKLLIEIRRALGLLGSKKINKLFATIDLSEDFSLIKEALNTPAFFHTVPGVNPLQKEQIVLTVVNAIINSGKSLTKENIQEMINNGFVNQIVEGKSKFQSLIDKLDALIESGSEIESLVEISQELKDSMKIFDTVEKNWKKFEDDIRVQLYKYAGLDENQAISELENHHEGQDRIFDKESTELVSKNTLPEEMKKFFAGIENCYTDGTVIQGFLGVPTYVPFDVAINIVTRIIGSNPKAGMTFEDVIKILGREKEAVPFLGNVISKLSDPKIMTEQIKNRFMTHMVKHNMTMQYVQYKYDRKSKRYELRVFDTNSSQVEKVIFREWMNGVKASKLVRVDEDSRDSMINKDEAQTLHTEFREMVESINKDNKTNQFVKWLTKNLAGKDYTKQEILKILTQTKKSAFTEQVSEAIDRNLDENKTFSKTELIEWLPTSEFSNERLINWLAKFNIVLSNRTIESLKVNGYVDHKGQEVNFTSMFEESSKSSGVFGGIAYKLSEYINTSEGRKINITEDPQMHPFRSIETSLKSLAKEEGRFSSRAVTISFRDAGKSYSGFVPPKFATDRIDELKEDTDTRKNLQKDPYSSNSMLLKLLTGDYGTEIQELLRVVHIGGSAMRKAGESNPTGNKNAIINLADGDQEITRQGFFQDTRQGKISVSNTYNGLKLRIANMFFPTMSDKKQILTMTMPVLDLTSKEIGYKNNEVQANDAVKEALFQQLVVPELKRIIAFHRGGGQENNIEGVDLASQVFLMIPQLNELKIGNRRLIEVLVSLQDKEIAKTMKDDVITDDIKDEAIKIIMKVVTKEVNNKIQNWKDSGIITEKGNPEMLNDEYFNPDDGERRFVDNKSELAATDFVINSLISYSNMFQTVGGDIAYYSQDKAFDKFPVDVETIKRFKEIDEIEYGAVIEQIETLYNTGIINKIAYKHLKETVKPLPYMGDNKQAYIDLTKNIGTNLGKRLALMLAPGLKPYGLDTNYRQLFLKDSVDIADNMEYIVELHYGEDGVKRFNEIMAMDTTEENKEGFIKEEFPTISAFFAVDSTDAQEYTTAKEHLDILFALGRISEQEHKDFTAKAEDQYRNGVTKRNKLEDKELRVIFQPMKPVYTGSHFDGQKMRMMYIKTSAYPLLPQVTAGTALEDLRKVMDEVQYGKELGGMNVRATYKTGAKVGATVTEIDPFAVDNKGNLTVGKLTVDELEKSSVTLDRRNFRIQQDVPFHALGSEEKTSVVSIGTQLMKLLFGDGVTDIQGFQYGKGKPKSGKELLKTYNETFGELTDHLKQELYDELGLNSNGQPLNPEYFMSQLSLMLQREAKKRNYPQQDIDALEIIDVGDRKGGISGFIFRNPLWMSSNAMRYESLLNSLITNKLIKLKMPGYAYVAGSQKGFETAHKVKDEETASRIIYTKHYNSKTGLIAARKGKKAQILIPSRFRNSRGELIDLFEGTIDANNNERNQGKYVRKVNGVWQLKEKMIDGELLDVTSFRIPTSSHVSASQVEIAGFLPPEAGDLMIVPKEFAVQKGLDYDIDKEFSYNLWHATDENGRIVALNEHIDIDKISFKLDEAREELRQIRIGDANFYEKLKEIENLPEDEVNNKLEKALAAILNSTKYKTTTVEDVVIRIKALQKIRKKYLENEIVRIHSAVMGSDNPEVQRRINKVLSMDYASQQAEKLQDEDAEFNTLLSDEYQTKKMNLGAVGQMAIGVYSNFVVFNSLLQQSSSNISINVGDAGLTIGNYKSDGKLGRYTNILSSNTSKIIVDIINSKKGLQETKTAQIEKLKEGSLTYYEISEIVKDTKIFIDEEGNRTSEKEGGIEINIMDDIRTTSEAFAERQNTATDNEKEQILGRVGVNSGTINVDSILTLLGFDKGEYVKDANGELVLDKARKPIRMSISYLLISQPIVKEYIKRKQNRTAKINKIFPTNEEMLAELIDEFGGMDSLKTDDILTTQNMYDAAKNGVDNGIQLNALFMFLRIQEYSMSLSATQQLVGIMKNGLDKSLFNTTYLYELLSNIAFDENFENITDIIGDFKFGDQSRRCIYKTYNYDGPSYC
ncbi:MAG: hypothetical protein ACTSQF_00240 [Candidatus Heimdallarchaeaceae archaeon]